MNGSVNIISSANTVVVGGYVHDKHEIPLGRIMGVA